MKLKTKEVKALRLDLLKAQGYKCALCSLDLTEEKAVLDHSHKSGAIRAVLHRSCNSLLGKVENNAPRYGVNLEAFTQGLGQFLALHSTPQSDLIHPSHFTLEEKKARTKVRLKRKAKRILTKKSPVTDK